MSALVIANPLGPQLPVLSAELIERRDDLVAAAAACAVISSTETLLDAEKTFRAIDAYTKQVHTERLDLTRKIDALKAEIMDAEKQAVRPLTEVRTRLASAIDTYREAVERERREAERRARAEAERIAAEEAAKRRAEAEAQAEAQREAAAEEAALFGASNAPTEPTPPPVVVSVPVQMPAAVVAAPALPPSAVRKQVRAKLRILDPAAILAEACKHGGSLYGRQVLTIDEKAIEALLKAGVTVTGAELEEVRSLGSSGR